MKEIPLTQGKVALVDDDMFEYIKQWKWHYSSGYAARNNGGTIVLMHREIMGFPKEMEVDHIDGNKVNNVRSNLRICTHAENGMNYKKPKNNTSGSKGVSWHKKSKKWQAYIKVNGSNKHIGVFDNLQDASKAYNDAALKYFGEFSKLNDVQ